MFDVFVMFDEKKKEGKKKKENKNMINLLYVSLS